MTEPRRIALIRLSHLGDVVLALPLYHALRARFPSAEIAWVVQSEFAELVAGLPGLARAVRFERRGGARVWLALRDELARFAPDLAVDAQANLKSAVALLCTGAVRRVGLAARDWRERVGAIAANERVREVARADAHAMERVRALCEHFAPGLALRTDPALTDAEREGGREAFASRFGRAPGAPVVLHVARAADVRSWPIDRTEALARALARCGRDVLALSGPGEVAEGERLAASTRDEPAIRHWIGQRGLRELAALFAAVADAGGALVGSDSGPAHLAAACALPVVVLAGPQSHRRTGPWPVAALDPGARPATPHRAVRAAVEPACAPCLRRECRHAQGPVCMSGIDVDRVLAALRSLAPGG